MLNEFRSQFSREDRPRDYNGPTDPRPEPPFPGHRRRLCRTVPLRPAVLHSGRGPRHALSVQRQRICSSKAPRIKFGVEFNRTSTTQTFVGFANGRYIFDSVQGFMNYVNIGPKFVECSNGTTNNNGVCPGRHHDHRSAAAIPPVRRSGRAVGERGGHAIDPAVRTSRSSSRTSGRSRRNLTLSYGLRWEGQIEPDPITPPIQVFFSPFIWKPGFPRRHYSIRL